MFTNKNGGFTNSENPSQVKSIHTNTGPVIFIKKSPHGRVTSVKENSKKTAPGRAFDQIGHVLLRLICAFTESSECAKIIQAKGDIMDWFWRLDFNEGEQWNFFMSFHRIQACQKNWWFQHCFR